MRVAVDLDGVLFDFMGDWTRRWMRDTGEHIDPKAKQRYDTIHETVGLNRGEFWEWHRETGGFGPVRLYPGAAGQLALLNNAGHTVILATNRPDWARVATVEAVVGLHHSSLYMGPDKTELCADLWIDDNPQVIADVVLHSGPDAAIARFQPWNILDWKDLDIAPGWASVGATSLIADIVQAAAARLDGVPLYGD